MSRNNGYTTRNVLDYLYHQKYFNLLGTDLQSKQIQVFLKKSILQEN